MFSLAYLHLFRRDVYDTLVSGVSELNRNFRDRQRLYLSRSLVDRPMIFIDPRENLIGGINSLMPVNKVRTEQEPVAETLSSQESSLRVRFGRTPS